MITALSGPGDLVAALGPAAAVFAAAAAADGRRALATAGQKQGGGPSALLAGSCPETTQAALAVVTACATPGCSPPGAQPGVTAASPGDLVAACQRVLAPGGLLAVITSAASHPGHAGDLTAAARAAGLVYTQHIVAVHAAIAGGRLRPGAAADRAPRSRPAGPHRPVHSDLLLFRRPGGPRHD